MKRQQFEYTTEDGDRLMLVATLDLGYAVLWHSRYQGRGFIVRGGIAYWPDNARVSLPHLEAEWIRDAWGRFNWLVVPKGGIDNPGA